MLNDGTALMFLGLKSGAVTIYVLMYIHSPTDFEVTNSKIRSIFCSILMCFMMLSLASKCYYEMNPPLVKTRAHMHEMLLRKQIYE